MSDDGRLDLDAGLWLSVSEIAREKGKSRQAIAKRVAELVEAGKLETRSGPNGTKLVNLAAFDRAVGETGDAVKEGAAEARAEIELGNEPTSPALRDHQARSAQYSADLKYLELEERLGRLVLAAEVKEAGQKAGEAIVRILDRLPTYAEVIAAASIKDGTQGARASLKEIARELRAAIADAMGIIRADAAPSTIEPGNESDPA
jgi:DNA-binding Lrp family transcriptional regulator